MNKYLNKAFVSFLSISAFLFACFLFADQGNTEQASQQRINKELQEQLDSLQAFQSVYKQVVINKENRIVEESEGSFYLGSNKAFKHTITTPEHSTIVSNGERLWMIDYELEQVSVNYLKDYLSGSPIALLLEGSEKSIENFTVSKLNSKKSNNSYRLVAIDPHASISEVRLGFIKNKITSIEINEKSGNRVDLRFSKITTLKNPEKVFLVDVPKGFDAVDETDVNEAFSKQAIVDEP